MNNLDKQYQALLQDILDNGVTKRDRTGTGTISVFGRQIRHKMSDGFPLLTTKKMSFKTITTELLWFLRGDTNIKFLVDNGCHIWTGDCYKKYETEFWKENPPMAGPYTDKLLTIEEFTNQIKTDADFAEKWGDLGPVYGKQWRDWGTSVQTVIGLYKIDQITNLINDLKTNPDSRRLMVSAWNVGELDQMTLPPCHYGFQVYTRELSAKERWDWYGKNGGPMGETKLVALMVYENEEDNSHIHSWLKTWAPNVPTRAISLMWNQRSVDTFLGLPFNIASYGLLLEIIAKEVNMVPDELIGNLGDTHLYLNHIEQAKEQIGRELTHDERVGIACKPENGIILVVPMYGDWDPTKEKMNQFLDEKNIPKRTREPFPLPKLIICDDMRRTDGFTVPFDELDHSLLKLIDYQSHPTIKAPLSN
ncbi:Thymidylate synthase [uncultured Caudovirales phage]|uniref:thymidylate synthase n=1 Tax=uncultured Caudovirales phage TaxID=2100421 RepID=A0A6J5PZ29_9CAUD|nr:Thymidylate synthase [uncultured Caudovirales phage]CAB4193004.1 Thymidylate synthase [uncultured Caudovirales phage]